MSPSEKDLTAQIASLQRELEAANAERTRVWSLFAEISRRLQVSSASIKAAVSSLLNYDIFWDPANQHEFLQTIDNSVDKVSRLILLLGLAFRSEAGSLELKREYQELPEILAVIQANAANRSPNLHVRFNFPRGGKPVLVDYEYLTIAFGFLFELLEAHTAAGGIQVDVYEEAESWLLDFTGLDKDMVNLVQTMQACKAAVEAVEVYPHYLLPESVLGLQVACEIFHLQDMYFESGQTTHDLPLLRLVIPIVEDGVADNGSNVAGK